MALSFDQVYALARSAGANPSDAVILTAISEPESGRDPGSANYHDNNDTQWSLGLFQISTGRKTVPDPHWDDPFVNARLAIQKLRTQGLSAWGTYNTGKYVPYLDDARAAQARVEGHIQDVLKTIHGKNIIQKGIDAITGLPKKAAGAAFDAVSGPFADALGAFQTETKKLALTGLFGAAGIGLMVVGLVQLVSPTLKQNVKAAATTAATKGAA